MRTAIIGFGRMGQRHAQVVRKLGLELVGVADFNIEKLSEECAAFGLPPEKCFKNAVDLINVTEPECVIVASTAPNHCESTLLAAESGAKYILCEKPLSTSLADCDAMIETCERNAVRLAVNHQMRFMEQYTIPKGLIQSGDYGELSSISVIAGNFGMAMNGTHYFEMLRYITDDVPSEVVAWFSPEDIPNPRGPQFVDKAGSVRVTTRRGKRFYMDISADQGHGMLAVYAARNGRIVVDELTGEMKTAVRKPEHRDLPTTRYGMPFVESTQKISPADVIAPSMAVLQALLNNENFPSGADGRKAVEVLVAAYISAESGNRVVRLDRDLLPCQRSFPWA